jgi:hypothetical protein
LSRLGGVFKFKLAESGGSRQLSKQVPRREMINAMQSSPIDEANILADEVGAQFEENTVSTSSSVIAHDVQKRFKSIAGTNVRGTILYPGSAKIAVAPM